jgi:uncharacterized protein (DUF305 family)
MKARSLVLTASGLALTVLLTACGSTTTSDRDTTATAPVAPTTSSADISFAQLMIPHHQQAIQMADLALTRSSSFDVRQLAEQIKEAQEPEIMMMSDLLDSWDAPLQMDGTDHGGHDMGGMSMAGMMSDDDLQSLGNASGEDFDRMWLQMMIAHHQGAVAMAEQVASTGSNADVATLADAIMAGQTAEIDAMQKMLAK